MTAASQELALPTVGEFLSAVGVAAQVVYPEHPGAPVVSLDIPYDWHEVIREVLPAAFGAWALPPEEDTPPEESGWVDNAVLMVWRMSRPVDPAAVMRCAFTDSRRLPDWQERRTKTADRDGFPSAAISGTYTFGELSLWVSTRYLMAGTPTGQYLLQLSVTTRADDDRDGRFIAGSLGVQSPIMQPPPAAHALRSEPSGPHTRPEPALPPRQPEPPAPLAWSEADPVARPESAPRSGALASVVRSESSPAEVRSEPDSIPQTESPVAWSESSDVDEWNERAAAEAWLESRGLGPRSESAGVRSESTGVDECADEDEWDESPDLGGRSESAGGAASASRDIREWSESAADGVKSDSLASAVRSDFFASGMRSGSPDPARRGESLAARSDSVDLVMLDESDAVWTGPLEAVGGSASAARGRSESAGEGWSREPVPLAWSEAPDVDGRSESAPLAWSESPNVDEPESAGGAWSESSDEGEWGDEDDWDESDVDGWGDEGDWVDEDEVSEESAELEPPVTWAETPSLVVRSESVAAGVQSEPVPVVRDALLPVLGAEGGPEPEGDVHRSGNVDFHI